MPVPSLGGVICLTAVGLGQEVGVKAVRNVLGSCHVRTRSAEEWNPTVCLANWMEPQGLA